MHQKNGTSRSVSTDEEPTTFVNAVFIPYFELTEKIPSGASLIKKIIMVVLCELGRAVMDNRSLQRHA